jgi:hypothetical protein
MRKAGTGHVSTCDGQVKTNRQPRRLHLNSFHPVREFCTIDLSTSTPAKIHELIPVTPRFYTLSQSASVDLFEEPTLTD